MVDSEHDSEEVTRVPRRADLIRIAEALNDLSAEYIVIGGMAMIEHGLPRTTMDIDLLVKNTPENVDKIRRALAVLEDKASLDLGDEDLNKYTVIRVNDEITIDLMSKACAMDYDSAWPLSVTRELDGVLIPFASIELLWKTKQTYRKKDSLDRAFLKELMRKGRIKE